MEPTTVTFTVSRVVAVKQISWKSPGLTLYSYSRVGKRNLVSVPNISPYFRDIAFWVADFNAAHCLPMSQSLQRPMSQSILVNEVPWSANSAMWKIMIKLLLTKLWSIDCYKNLLMIKFILGLNLLRLYAILESGVNVNNLGCGFRSLATSKNI